jgi:type I restriction enzyme M protein
MARILDPVSGMEIYDPCCGSGGLLIKCSLALEEIMADKGQYVPLKMYGQEYTPNTWAMANMNMIIHDMEGEIEIGDTFKNPKFKNGLNLRKFDRVVANPMWNQDWFTENDYDADELGRFPKEAGFPGKQSADWGWVQHIFSSLNENGQAAIVLDTGAVSRGSGSSNTDKERDVRKYFIDNDYIEGVIYLPENLFYNTTAPGILLFLNRNKSTDRKGKLFLLNASKEFEKGDPKNFVPEESIIRIANTFNKWQEIEKFSQIVTLEDVKKKDYNISPTRYINSELSENFRSIKDIIYDLEAVETQIKITDEKLSDILDKFH